MLPAFLPAEQSVNFKSKDYRAKGSTKHKTMTLGTGEFMRRFLLHAVPMRPKESDAPNEAVQPTFVCPGNPPILAIARSRDV